MNNTQSYKDLLQHFQIIKSQTLIELFNNDFKRAEKFSIKFDQFFLDFSKNHIVEDSLDLLIKLAIESNLSYKIKEIFNGSIVNNTEHRAVLHSALRRSYASPIYVNGNNVIPLIKDVLNKMCNFSQKVHSGIHTGYTGKKITDIVNIGIGGSDLGPSLVCSALKPYKQNKINIHFISSVDGYQIFDSLSELNPETTLFIIASKTFNTQETLTNAVTARKWFLNHVLNYDQEEALQKHFVAVSANVQAAINFGIKENNIFPMWDFVGGRYSLWSSVGLSIILYIGFDNFKHLLAGAEAMDKHFYNVDDLRQNMPVILALLGIWNINFFGYGTHVISPYNTRLAKLPAYIQQLEMESNGKSVNKNGQKLEYKTCPVIWGDSGINGQHAYYQLLHQGTSINPMDIIITSSTKFSNLEHNDILNANAFAQAEAFMIGKSYTQAKSELLISGLGEMEADFLAKHKTFTGNRPTNMLILSEISPYTLGGLIALYEHKTFVQGIIWNINSFDQMGVELGKELAKIILANIHDNTNKNSNHDSSTSNLIDHYLKYR